MATDRNINILVIDDEPIVRQLMQNLLRKLGFNNVDEATDGQTALAKLGEKDYGLLFSDWKMGPMNGIDLVKRLRLTGNRVPIIMITSNNTVQHEAEAKKAGATDFIRKDIDLRALQDKMNIILGK